MCFNIFFNKHKNNNITKHNQTNTNAKAELHIKGKTLKSYLLWSQGIRGVNSSSRRSASTNTRTMSVDRPLPGTMTGIAPTALLTEDGASWMAEAGWAAASSPSESALA